MTAIPMIFRLHWLAQLSALLKESIEVKMIKTEKCSLSSETYLVMSHCLISIENIHLTAL